MNEEKLKLANEIRFDLLNYRDALVLIDSGNIQFAFNIILQETPLDINDEAKGVLKFIKSIIEDKIKYSEEIFENL